MSVFEMVLYSMDILPKFSSQGIYGDIFQKNIFLVGFFKDVSLKIFLEKDFQCLKFRDVYSYKKLSSLP